MKYVLIIWIAVIGIWGSLLFDPQPDDSVAIVPQVSSITPDSIPTTSTIKITPNTAHMSLPPPPPPASVITTTIPALTCSKFLAAPNPVPLAAGWVETCDLDQPKFRGLAWPNQKVIQYNLTAIAKDGKRFDRKGISVSRFVRAHERCHALHVGNAVKFYDEGFIDQCVASYGVALT